MGTFKRSTFSTDSIPIVIEVNITIGYLYSWIFIIVRSIFSKVPFNLLAIFIKVKIVAINDLFTFYNFTFVIKIVPVTVHLNKLIVAKINACTRIFIIIETVICENPFSLNPIFVKEYGYAINDLLSFKSFRVWTDIEPFIFIFKGIIWVTLVIDLNITISNRFPCNCIIKKSIRCEISLNLDTVFTEVEMLTINNLFSLNCIAFVIEVINKGSWWLL